MSVSKRGTRTSAVIRSGNNPDVPAVADDNGSRAVSPSAEIAAVGGASRSVDRPLALQGVRIPNRDATIRRRVVAIFAQCPWLVPTDVDSACRYVWFGRRFARLADTLDRLPPVKVSGDDAEPRKLDKELRDISHTMSDLESRLALTATARAGLGVNLGRLQDHVDRGSTEPGEDVLELEQRVIAGLSDGGGGGSVPVVSPAASEEGADG